MQIIDQKSLRAVWEWNKDQDQNLRLLYEKNLARLMAMIEERATAGNPIPTTELDALSKEIQDAAEVLNICTLNCYVLSQFAYIQAGVTPEDQQKRHEWIIKLEGHLGGKVVVTDTSIPELQGEQVQLEALLGTKAVINFNGQQYETPMERVVLVLEGESVPAPSAAAEPAAPAPAAPAPVPAAAAKPVVAAPPPAPAAAEAPSGPAPVQLKIMGKPNTPKNTTGDLAVLKPRLTDTQILGKKAGLRRPSAAGSGSSASAS